MEELNYSPIVLAGIVINYTLVKVIRVMFLYAPAVWRQLATLLHAIMTQNATELLGVASLFTGPSDIKIAEYLAGIECSDKTPRASSLTEILPSVEQLFQQSYFSDVQMNIIATCAHWKMTSREHYSGNFQAKTRNPIMLIGNTYDPVTPLISAFNVSNGFEGSVVLQHNGYGVSFLSQFW